MMALRIELVLVLCIVSDCIHFSFEADTISNSNECGSSPVSSSFVFQKRITNGARANIANWPWIAALINGSNTDVDDPGFEGPFCGGSVISSRFILTAAHCVSAKSRNEFRVILGQENFLTKNKEDLMFIETHEIKTISIHPRYKPEDLYIDDIAILEVKTPIVSSNVRQTICLPNQTTKSYSGKTGVVLGWGSEFFRGPSSRILQEAAVRIWDQSECQNAWKGKRTILSSMVCAGGENGIDSCQGDSGGPLSCFDSANNRWEICGIVSFGYKCGTDVPAVHTRITEYLEWIEKIIGKDQRLGSMPNAVSTTITPAVPFSSTSRATNVPTTIAQIFTSINSSSIFTTSKISSTLNPTTTAASAASIPTTKSMISTATSDESLQGCFPPKMDDKEIIEANGLKLFEENNVGVVGFHSSVADGNLECVRKIANAAREKGQLNNILNSRDSEGKTPLHEASANGLIQIVKYLVSQGANLDSGINIKGNLEGMTPLILSCVEGHVEVLKYFLALGSNVRRQADNGLNCASWARLENKVDILKHILPLYPDLVQTKSFNGRQLLHLASWKGSLASAITILKNGGDGTLENKDNEGNTPLGLASYFGRLSMVKLLVQNGANINHVGYHMKDVIELARWKSHSEIVALLNQYKQRTIFRSIIQ